MARKTTSKKSSKKPRPSAKPKKSKGARAAKTSKSAKAATQSKTPQSKKSAKQPASKTGKNTAATSAKAAKAASPSKPEKAPTGKKTGATGKAAAAGTTTQAKGSGGKGKQRGQSVAEAASAFSADSKGYVFINGRRVRMISTKGQAPTKKPRSNGSIETTSAEPATPVKLQKTKLGKKELNHYRDLLLEKRREIVGDLSAMENEALRSGGGNLSHMPIHMADIGTDTFDQDFMLGLAENERQQLREIDAALARIEDRTYGVCQMTGQPIPKARLDAKPWAKYTIEAARQLEGQWGRS